MKYGNPGGEKTGKRGLLHSGSQFFCPVFVITYPVSLVSLIRRPSFPKEKPLGAYSRPKECPGHPASGFALVAQWIEQRSLNTNPKASQIDEVLDIKPVFQAFSLLRGVLAGITL